MYHDPSYVNAEIEYRRAQIVGGGPAAPKRAQNRGVGPRFGGASRIRWRRAYGH